MEEKSPDETPVNTSDMKKLRELIQQRDNEISILY